MVINRKQIVIQVKEKYMNVIETNKLTKSYGKSRGINELMLTVEEGDFFGFIGPNGAGKSTTMNMICGIVKPTLGSVEFHGKDFDRHRKELIVELGYIPQELAIHGNLRHGKTWSCSHHFTGSEARNLRRGSMSRLNMWDCWKRKMIMRKRFPAV